jgi:hypothetical protein
MICASLASRSFGNHSCVHSYEASNLSPYVIVCTSNQLSYIILKLSLPHIRESQSESQHQTPSDRSIKIAQGIKR